MPILMKQAAGQLVATVRVTPPELDSTGPNAEWFEIPRLLDDAANKTAREAARTTIQQGSRTREEFDQEKYFSGLFASHLKNWRLMAAPDEPFDATRMTQEVDHAWWTFTPANVATITGSVALWLANEILSRGGVIPTASLTIKTESGQVLDFRGETAGVGTGEVPPVPDPVGDPVVSETGPGGSPA